MNEIKLERTKGKPMGPDTQKRLMDWLRNFPETGLTSAPTGFTALAAFNGLIEGAQRTKGGSVWATQGTHHYTLTKKGRRLVNQNS